MNLLLSSDEEELDNKLNVNRKFAQSFESKKRTQELNRSKTILLEDDDDEEIDSEDEESEDEDGEALSTSLDLKIIKTISSLKTRDPKIYDAKTRWFDDKNDEYDDEEDESSSVEVSNNKRKTYKDVIREQLLKHGADIEEGGGSRSDDRQKLSTLLYDEEQASLRSNFLIAAADIDDDTTDVLQLRVKTATEMAREETELKEALAEMQSLEPNKSEADAFLLDYIAKQKWKDESSMAVFDPNEDDYEREEEELDRLDNFESKYNFRFEELAAGLGSVSVQIASHARTVEDSVRREDVNRQKQREARKERKEKEKRQKEAELRRLKNLKRQELQERLRKIGEVGGVSSMYLDESVLDEDWDPDKHEAAMEAQFGEDYYAAGEFEELEGGEEGGDEEEGEYSDERAKLQKDLRALDDLDYEDLIGDLVCRFKYRSVEPESFGLSTEEILEAEDVELNQLVSLKKIAAYRDGGADRSLNAKSLAKKRRRLRLAMKERAEVTSEEPGGDAVVEATDSELQVVGEEDEKSKGKRRRRRKQTRESGASGAVEDLALPVSESVSVPKDKLRKVTTDSKSKRSKPKSSDDAKSKKKQRMMLYS